MQDVWKISDIKGKTEAELKQALVDISKAMFKIRMAISLGKEGEKTHKLKQMKKSIARIKTVLAEEAKNDK